MSTVRRDAARKVAVIVLDISADCPDSLSSRCHTREIHAHSGDQLRFPAEMVIPSRLLYICPVLMLKYQPFLFHLQNWAASVLVSPPYSVKTNSRYLPDMPASASAGTLLLLPAAQVMSMGKVQVDFCLPVFPI